MGCFVKRVFWHTLVQSLKIVELGCEAALAGGVDDEDDLALELGQREVGSLVVFGLEVEESGCGRHGSCGACEERWS